MTRFALFFFILTLERGNHTCPVICTYSTLTLTISLDCPCQVRQVYFFPPRVSPSKQILFEMCVDSLDLDIQLVKQIEEEKVSKKSESKRRSSSQEKEEKNKYFILCK